ncbi:phage tail sheath subtilisin-like domain-containing protein [Asticcacaulis endophyticus]|uniref:Tail sheath protein n=1 Tax=Asticcacaulis endophyticus TaxID=1395890 RepID=A0A918Q626_9CAUL|nr:phage tail sheath subtilisin-like domain-containing protein [Asticcacaulis endophyticus]GGZ31993.1 tail sheath protein [Asticcacaulis endophyticus]
MANPHGIKTLEITTGTRPSAEASTAVIGLVATSSDADIAAFPADTPVLFTDIYAAIAKAGVNGTLSKSLLAIAQQCNPTLVIVRVAEGANPAATETAIVGTVTNAGKKTGLKALLAAKAQLGVQPKIIGVPGLDTQVVATELASIAAKLDAMAYVRAIGATIAEATAYRAGFISREMMLIWPDFTDWTGSAVARALGLRALIDQREGWHRSLSNVAVQGVTGLSKDVFFDISGENTDTQILNDAEVTALIRNEGFRFWGNRTCSDEPLFAFEPAVRSGAAVRQIIRDSLTWAIDKPLTASLVKDIIETGNNALRKLVAQGYLIGASMWYDPAKNAQAQLAGGKLVIDYDYTPCAPLESLTLNQRITDTYYANLADQIAA